MAEWAKQWTYLSNFMGEGSKPEQLYTSLVILIIIICILYQIEIYFAYQMGGGGVTLITAKYMYHTTCNTQVIMIPSQIIVY